MDFHGGNIYRYNNTNLIDFSSNINPLGIPYIFKKKLIDNLDVLTRYPDIHYKKMRETIGSYLGVDNFNSVIPGNGAVEIIYKTLLALDIEEVLIAAPTFAQYRIAAGLKKIPYEEVVVYMENGKFLKEKLLEKINNLPNKSLVIICNPNNPTGTLIPLETIEIIAQKLIKKKGYLLLDEAFIEFTDNYPVSSMVKNLKNYQNIIIIRAATKFFGIPGIRLGYGVSENELLINKIKGIMEPWNVNALAVLAGETIFLDKNYIKDSRKWIRKEKVFFERNLEKLSKVIYLNSQANFILLKIKDMEAQKVKKMLLQRNILIRTLEGFTGIDQNYFRVAIKDRRNNEYFFQKLKEVIFHESNS
ncbi:pyridoxal phosphate-dependent aminotransferase [Anaerobranca gottschalkii]|uniref:Threonine-phosphate decarboxylase n=1 Tax=Anaerobranca gottschalkii DSM 13577 TaxID=1120990 RepID=A0A1I0A456_9FIRM|nr:histidinol-phosphate transaminase [Anaerobranca gottschalkii]SES87966.1 threonine-phosphate decarboxylase [Anaerobranca gottschalkii DSM 13577]